MKKLVYNQYGLVDVLKLVEAPVPTLLEDSILVKVKATSINPLDWKLFKGEMKMMSGSKFPKEVGIDFAGIVENTGNKVVGFQKGDEVFGMKDIFKGGGVAEYVTVTAKDLVLKPVNISFEQAAALPVAGSAALQIFDELLGASIGKEVLLNGATGGIGMFAIQLAKKKGALVTSVTSSKGIELAKKWGSSFVIDYKKQNILTMNKQYDSVIDLSGKLSFKEAKVLLKKNSIYVNTTPGPKEMISSFFHNLFSSKKYKILILKPSSKNLRALSQLAKADMDIYVDRVYPIAFFKEAYTETGKGGVLGKAVVTLF